MGRRVGKFDPHRILIIRSKISAKKGENPMGAIFRTYWTALCVDLLFAREIYCPIMLTEGQVSGQHENRTCSCLFSPNFPIFERLKRWKLVAPQEVFN